MNRAAIAAALSEVDGVTGYEYRPTTPLPGDAWSLLTGFERDSGFLIPIQRVLVFLPQNEQEASTWIDDHVAELVDGLLPVGYIDRIDPAETTPGQLVLQITMRSE